MTIFKRQELPDLLKAIDEGETSQIYLIFGERYLCQQAADQVVAHLLPDASRRTGNLFLLDGEQEDPGQTLNQLRTYSLFGGRRVTRVMDSRLLHSKVVAKTIWEKAVRHYQNNDLAATGRYLRQLLEIGSMTPADLEELPASSWKAKLGFPRPSGNLAWISEILGNNDPEAETATKAGKEDITDLYTKAFEEGLPQGNILVLVTDAADKRKKFYKFLTQHGSVLDLSVDTGTNKAAADAQKEVLADIVRRTLAASNKKIEPRALEVLLERIGFHPVAAALESEKLALYVETEEKITIADLNAVIGRTREEAVYELSEAFANLDLTTTLTLNSRLLENGSHPLVIVAALRNHLKKMLLIRSLLDLESPSYSPGLSFPAFKGGYLERLKSERGDWPKELPGHPYALYMMFQKVEKFPANVLSRALAELLTAEYRLKSSALPGKIVLENMFFKLLDQQHGLQRRATQPLRYI